MDRGKGGEVEPVRRLCWRCCCCCCLGRRNGAQGERPSEARTPWVQAFDLISEDGGWLLSGGRLYWTASGGREWREITPGRAGAIQCPGRHVPRLAQGWMIAAQEGQDDSASYTLARTSDGGRTWRTEPPALFEAGAAEPMPVQFSCFSWTPRRDGWWSGRQAGSNFRWGSLFRTADGGDSWTRQSMPIGEPVYFVTREVGWTAGGAAGGELYVTRDGGRAGAAGARRPQKLVYLPRFDDPETGTLPVITLGDGAAQLELYATRTAAGRGSRRKRAVGAGRHAGPGRGLGRRRRTYLAGSRAGQHAACAVADSGRVDAVSSGDAAVAGMVALDMATAEVGWARSLAGQCDCPTQEGDGSQDAAGPASCRQSTLYCGLRMEEKLERPVPAGGGARRRQQAARWRRRHRGSARDGLANAVVCGAGF